MSHVARMSKVNAKKMLVRGSERRWLGASGNKWEEDRH
jgi:hypothetical protein